MVCLQAVSKDFKDYNMLKVYLTEALSSCVVTEKG